MSRSTSTEPVKTRSLHEIYEAGAPNSFSLFALFSPLYDPLKFEEFVEEEVWAQAMDEEIECIEKNQIWELVDVPKDKYASTSNGFTRPSKMLMVMCRRKKKEW